MPVTKHTFNKQHSMRWRSARMGRYSIESGCWGELDKYYDLIGLAIDSTNHLSLPSYTQNFTGLTNCTMKCSTAVKPYKITYM